MRKKTVKLFDCSLFKLPISICGIGGRAAGCLGEFEAGPAKESERLLTGSSPHAIPHPAPRGSRPLRFFPILLISLLYIPTIQLGFSVSAGGERYISIHQFPNNSFLQNAVRRRRESRPPTVSFHLPHLAPGIHISSHARTQSSTTSRPYIP